MGWACWRQLSMSNVWYSLGGAHTFWFSMGLEGGFGMGLLASTFDVESVVFLMRGSHFLAFYGAGGRPCDRLVGGNLRCRVCGIPYAGLTLCGFPWGWREALGLPCWRQLSMSKVWYSLGGAHTFWLSMGLVFLLHHRSHSFTLSLLLLASYGAGGRPTEKFHAIFSPRCAV